MEHMDIYQKMQSRKDSKTVSMEESAKKYGIDLDDL